MSSKMLKEVGSTVWNPTKKLAFAFFVSRTCTLIRVVRPLPAYTRRSRRAQ